MIKFLAMDVDGTLTDGKIYMGKDGEILKAFNVKDGYAIKELLPKHDIVPIIITARHSKILENRCKELDITEFYQGERKKFDRLMEVILSYCAEKRYTLENAAYIGDDILDIQCLKSIKEAGGMTGCPADAVQEVKDCCDYIAPHKGGEGAVRDFIDYVISANGSNNN